MDEKEYSNIYAIPANYTDSGKLLGGMLEIRNSVEAIFLLLLVGYPEIVWLPVSITAKVVICTVTLVPLGILALMGINGDSFLQFLWHVFAFWVRRRKLHYKRIGYKYAKNETKAPGGKKGRAQPQKGKGKPPKGKKRRKT